MSLSRRAIVISGLGLAAGLARPASAHHGWSGYDSTTELTLTGPVREIYFGMPHCTAVVEADGKAWDCVLAPLSRMTSRGLPAGSIAVGDPVTVIGYPSRQETAEMRAERITVNDKTVELR
jgi:hypothetical protein